MDKKALIGPAPLAARFAADMRLTHSNFGLLVDLSHFPTPYEDSRFVIRCLRPYLTHFHIGNAVVKQGAEGYGDQHPRFGFPESANGVEELKLSLIHIFSLILSILMTWSSTGRSICHCPSCWRKRRRRDWQTGWSGAEFFSVRDAPVSYTHLDVYKRQIWAREVAMVCTSGVSRTSAIASMD